MFVRILIYGICVIGLSLLTQYNRRNLTKPSLISDNDQYSVSATDSHSSGIYQSTFEAAPNLHDKHIRQATTKPLCSNEILRMWYQRQQTLPSEGEWISHGCVHQPKLETQFTTVAMPPVEFLEVIEKYNKISEEHKRENDNDTRQSMTGSSCPPDYTNDYYFHPDICQFQYLHPPIDYMKKCLIKKKIRKIVTTGDSNGKHYHAALIDILSKVMNLGCVNDKVENDGEDQFAMDVKYFMGNMTDSANLKVNVTLEKRMCRSCGGSMTKCHFNNERSNESLIIEHIPLPHFQEISMKMLEEVNKLDKRTIYFPEFIFKHYMKDNYPDLLIIFAPFNHEKRRSSQGTVTRHTQYLLGILDKYLPSTTELYFIPTFHEFEPRKVWQNRQKKYEGLLANDMIDSLNAMLFKSINDKLLQTSSNYHSFWDMGRVSDEKLADWMWDGMHMLPVWYKNTISQILQIVCAGS